MRLLLSLLILAVAMTVSRSTLADHPLGFVELQIGDMAPDFKLKGIDDRDWTLADFSGAKVLVVYFTSNHCPVCHAQDPRLVSMIEKLEEMNVQVVAINPNSGDGLRPDELGYSHYDDSFEHMKLYAKDEGFTFPYLYDGDTQAVAKRYGCLATPHVFIFDAERKLRYKGWLDDSRYPDSSTVKRTDAANAIEALLSGDPVPVEVTKPFGCSTKWREKIAGVTQAAKAWKETPITLDKIDAAGIADLVKNPTEKYRLFNVWSTSCIPCIGEFPGLISISKRMGLRPFELITISTDLPDDEAKVKKFLSQMEAALPKRLKPSLKQEGRTSNNYLYSDPSMDDLINALDPKWEGPQPHTILVAPGGEVVFRHNGAATEKELLDAILEEMTTGYQPKNK